MLSGLRRFSALSPALPTLLARCWKARSLLFTTRNAQITQSSSYSSIADAMLSRALEEYQPPPTGRREKATAFLSSSNPTTTIDDILNSARQPSQKSLSGFARYRNPTSTSQPTFSRTSVQSTPVLIARGTKRLKRKSSEMDGIAAALNKKDSFQDPLEVIDLTQEDHTLAKSPPVMISAFDFDANDFDNDSDLDLDMEYPQALPPLSTTREPLRQLMMDLPQIAQSNPSLKSTASKPQPPPSSAQTWSSSPPSHKITPPGALLRRQAAEVVKTSALVPSSDASIDAIPRPTKRRTMPWLQRQAEQTRIQKEAQETVEIESFSESSGLQCFKCGEFGHWRESCSNRVAKCSKCGRYGHLDEACDDEYPGGKNPREELTPLPKDRSFPWNTTASAIKEQQKAFKNLQKKAMKNDDMSLADMQDAIRTSNQAKPIPIFLSDEQKNVLDLVIHKKKSVFFTGSAGTGKSVLMRSIIADLRKMYIREPDRVAVTASTGLAACNIGGVTLHSFSGIGLGKESVPELVKKIGRNQKAKNRWLRTKVLIIDEISMVDGELFDKLETIARILRKNGRPFGGIQLVITGDFFQLPPVPDHGKREVKFAFDAGTWSTTINHTIGLTEVFRQKDPVFANMLNELRLGKIGDETVKAFRRLERPIRHEDSLEATELFPTRNEVDNANSFKMRALQGKDYQFKAEDSGTMKDIAARDKLLANCMAPPLLSLKKGAQVMLIKNLDENLVNGSLGNVIAFMSEKTFEIYDKDPAVLEADNEYESEMGNSFRQAKNKLKSMINNGLIGDTEKAYPLVRFLLPDGTSRDLLCMPEDWKVELPNGEIQAQRRQLPLILAWALSIHKAQGQTLQRVTVDLRKVFEKGQAYVALSRATCQEGLQVKGFDKNKVMAHPRVGEFYRSLCSVNAALKHPKVADRSVTKRTKDDKSNFLEEMTSQGGSYAFDDDEEEAMAGYG